MAHDRWQEAQPASSALPQKAGSPAPRENRLIPHRTARKGQAVGKEEEEDKNPPGGRGTCQACEVHAVGGGGLWAHGSRPSGRRLRDADLAAPVGSQEQVRKGGRAEQPRQGVPSQRGRRGQVPSSRLSRTRLLEGLREERQEGRRAVRGARAAWVQAQNSPG